MPMPLLPVRPSGDLPIKAKAEFDVESSVSIIDEGQRILVVQDRDVVARTHVGMRSDAMCS